MLQSTITNCFKKAGFVLYNDENEVKTEEKNYNMQFIFHLTGYLKNSNIMNCAQKKKIPKLILLEN
ncbi:hypothetical protein HZS_7293 [Henneguya salminicola]|nr:hypothetical protein HZS_7293 [Henneguya salminicola]